MTKKLKKQLMELILFAGLILWVVFNYKLFIDLAIFVFNLIIPLIVGIAISFIINVPMKQIENKIFKIDKRKHKKLVRIISLLISILIIFGVLSLILFLVIPEFIEALSTISKNLPTGFKWIDNFTSKIIKTYPMTKDFFNDFDIKNIITTALGTSNNLITTIISLLSNMVSKLVTFFFGFIISIYILIDKENLVRQSKKLLQAIFNDDVTNEIIKIVKITNTTFTKFLTGQCLDACLTGFEFFIILSIIKIPYALILGVLFAITALIPYIGAFITLVVGAVLVSVVNPINALWYTLAFFVLQQFDDNFTYPKIVGKSVGLPPIWALIAVLLGGSIFGFIGMIISIPISSVLYAMLKEWVNYRISKKKLIRGKNEV